jgi:hypothetical protein
MTIRTYLSPEAFKQALGQRLRTSAKSGAAFARKRQLLVFDRFLARDSCLPAQARTARPSALYLLTCPTATMNWRKFE